jgi:hypothetical protein
MQIKLKGETLEGTFRGRLMSREGWAGSEYTERECTYCWYEGCGIITDNDNKYFFSFRTASREKKYHPNDDLTLDESLVYLGGRGYPYERNCQDRGISRTRIVPDRSSQLMDYALSDFVSQVKASDEEIPEVIPKELQLDDLIEKGFCYEDCGQMRLVVG